MRLRMTLTENATPLLWRSFMPERKNIRNTVSEILFNMQVFEKDFDVRTRTMDTPFENWAAQEVSSFDYVPEKMESYILRGGLYAVFIHVGPPQAFQKTFHYIFNVWLPASAYDLDAREHFEMLGEKYKNNHPDSEEEIWIPIKQKTKNG